MLVCITDYNGETSGQDLRPEAGQYCRNYVGVYEDCNNFKNMGNAFKYVSF